MDRTLLGQIFANQLKVFPHGNDDLSILFIELTLLSGLECCL
jgi:hypothetical protein